jgi:predicted nucleic acid-binding protein
MMNTTVCLDASLVVAILLPERYSAPAMALWELWIKQDVRMVAPALLGYEVTSAIYRKALQGKITWQDSQAALKQFVAMDIETIHLPELHSAAHTLAKQFNRSNTYDAHYLALAGHLACPLWTADERLYNTVKEEFGLIRWVEAAQ